MKKPIVISILICLFCATSLAFADKIYKWVDSEGNVHYSSEPGGKKAQEMQIHTAPPASAPAPAAKPAENAEPSFMETFDKEQKEKAEADAKAEKEKEVRAKNCEVARKNMQALQLGGRLFEIDEKGERKFLSDEEINSRLQKAKDDVAKWCAE